MTKKLPVTPEENAKELRRQVQIKLRSRYLERFDEFISDADDKISKAIEAIDDNNFAAEIVFDSDKSDDPRAKNAIESFKTAVELTTDSLRHTRVKREAAIRLKDLVEKNEKMLAIELLALFDQLAGV